MTSTTGETVVMAHGKWPEFFSGCMDFLFVLDPGMMGYTVH